MENNQEVQKTPNNQTSHEKPNTTIAVISYLWWIGFIAALILYNDKTKNNKNDFNIFHLRQSIGIHILSVIVYIFTRVFNFIHFFDWLWGLLGAVMGIIIFIFMILGIISAANGEKKPLPLIGEKLQEWFKGIK